MLSTILSKLVSHGARSVAVTCAGDSKERAGPCTGRARVTGRAADGFLPAERTSARLCTREDCSGLD
eukprot:scaffold19698_cov59-Phaeocystis_antarctica.AAC.7